MKNIFSLLLVLAICITFCSCGSSPKANSTNTAEAAAPAVAVPEPAETAPTVAAVPAEANQAGPLVSSVPQPEAAVAEAPAAAEEKPKTAVTVQITMENYLDYFEWVDNYTDEFDSSGAYKSRTQKHSFAVKQNLELAENAVNEVSVTYTGQSAYRSGPNISFDFENMTFSGAPSMNDSYEEGGSPSVSQLKSGQAVFDTYKVFIAEPGNNTVIDSYDIQILSITGTLTVYQ